MSLVSIFVDAFKKAASKKPIDDIDMKSYGPMGSTTQSSADSFTPLRPAPQPDPDDGLDGAIDLGGTSLLGEPATGGATVDIRGDAARLGAAGTDGLAVGTRPEPELRRDGQLDQVFLEEEESGGGAEPPGAPGTETPDGGAPAGATFTDGLKVAAQTDGRTGRDGQLNQVFLEEEGGTEPPPAPGPGAPLSETLPGTAYPEALPTAAEPEPGPRQGTVLQQVEGTAEPAESPDKRIPGGGLFGETKPETEEQRVLKPMDPATAETETPPSPSPAEGLRPGGRLQDVRMESEARSIHPEPLQSSDPEEGGEVTNIGGGAPHRAFGQFGDGPRGEHLEVKVEGGAPVGAARSTEPGKDGIAAEHRGGELSPKAHAASFGEHDATADESSTLVDLEADGDARDIEMDDDGLADLDLADLDGDGDLDDLDV